MSYRTVRKLEPDFEKSPPLKSPWIPAFAGTTGNDALSRGLSPGLHRPWLAIRASCMIRKGYGILCAAVFEQADQSSPASAG